MSATWRLNFQVSLALLRKLVLGRLWFAPSRHFWLLFCSR